MTTTIYIAPDVAEVDALHPYLTERSFRQLSIEDQIARQAETLHRAHCAGDRRVRMHLQCWWLAAIGRPLDEVMNMPLTEADARLTISREYGFSNWDAVTALGAERVDETFELALDEMLAGDLASLERRLSQAPNLAKDRTVFGHRSTLLHYLGANGVESHRQKMPLNAADAARLLISCGSDIKSVANMYGGGQTAYVLAQTSAHPYEAGIADELLHVLGGDPTEPASSV